ncbi:alpha/beta fold hydrolase [Ruegeria pomeroyi]|uniref:Alpha/beta fold hydrolase n=1 Tax=Ruegeria pomeroyi TaxID=89184 RepID=A0A9Q3WKJ2_9RHOB|nr:alpha/beta fold hydrolase [Ruegeria pomeroyi]MCE8537499.1 alpha/beta fold hydrolase [Ruegeria pomeroyi]
MRYAFANCLLDTDELTLVRDAEEIAVEPQVFDLLHLLARNPGRLVTRDEILAEVWNGRIVSESAISARIAAARKAVGDDGKAQRIIRTIARRGLKFVAEVTSDTPPALPRPAPMVQRIRYTRTAEGKSLAYAVIGAGPPVVRGGYNTTDLEAEWNTPSERAMFDAISEHHSLLRFDPIGFGRSDRSLEEFSFDTLAENLKLAADAAGFERFALYSESGGVLSALRFAVKYPERVSRLAIVGGYAEGRGRRNPELKSDVMQSLVTEGWTAQEISFVSAMMLSYFPEGPLDAIHDMARNMINASSRETMLKVRAAIHDVSLLPLLPQVRCPTLIIHARHDNVHPLSEAQKLAAGIPGAELMVLETANHIPIPGNAVWDEYQSTLLGFLGERERSPAQGVTRPAFP